jgi:hypothetical protein
MRAASTRCRRRPSSYASASARSSAPLPLQGGRGTGLMGLCSDYIGHCANWKTWTSGSRALGQSAAILTEKSRANSAKSLANVSCHERGKKYLTWQNASNAEPPPGIDERHLPARGKPILVSAIYFADGTQICASVDASEVPYIASQDRHTASLESVRQATILVSMSRDAITRSRNQVARLESWLRISRPVRSTSSPLCGARRGNGRCAGRVTERTWG